ncbi:aldo/keto reductase [Spirochaeta africana]|uniref:Putative oxidoreductase n=1 Tax=Spirochaeta africana (strain ATCC 700263 / DSM 8902 / Z-7692) TaxID=889378 RepID=H9UIP5_SPIAZ|nr:aldo/keto reductase [Spirochaeta africana]AFG37388.1 putative oxidoreductase [Spirochaeta africana DSM 8902]
MEYFTIAGTDLEVSAVGYGCMGLGGGWNSNPVSTDDINAARIAMETALESGINLFDHADIYAFGKAEACFGKVLSAAPELRQRMVLQSKCGIRLEDPESGAPQRYDLSRDWILHSVEGILERLGIDCLDILLLHRPDPLMRPDEIAEACSLLHAQGKVRWFGVSNFHHGQIELLQQSLDFPLIINQIQLSLVHSQLIDNGVTWNSSPVAADATIEHCYQREIQLQAWGSLDGGILTGRGVPESRPELSQAADTVSRLATQLGVSPEATALSWIMKHPARIQPIIGTTHPGRIAACAQAERDLLDRDQWYQLYTAVRGHSIP